MSAEAPRPCRPEDAPDAVPLVYSSGPAVFRWVFSVRRDDEALEFLERAFRQGGSEFGFDNHHGLERDGRLVAVGASWTAEDSGRFTRAALRQIPGHYGLATGLRVMGRGLRIERVLPPPAPGVLYVGHLGVAPELRGQGLGQRVIDHLEAGARRRGLAAACLDVALGNPRARSLYERLGYGAPQRLPGGGARNRYGALEDHDRLTKELPP